jgi:hypothetical protein
LARDVHALTVSAIPLSNLARTPCYINESCGDSFRVRCRDCRPVPSPGIGNPVRTVRKDGSPHPLDGFGQIIEVKFVGTLNVIRLVEAVMRRRCIDLTTVGLHPAEPTCLATSSGGLA